MIDEVNNHPEMTVVTIEQQLALGEIIKKGKKPHIKVSRPDIGDGQYYIQPLSLLPYIIEGEFDGAEEGDQLLLELIYMTDEEYEKLPEFEGW